MNVLDRPPEYVPFNGAAKPSYGPEKRRTGPSLALPIVTGASLAGKPVPELQFHDVKGLVPHTGVTLLYGDGGTGKSTVALQLAAATATGGYWLGIQVNAGPVFYFSAEDPIEVTHRRLADYAAFSGADLADMGDLHIAPMLGRDCVMATADRGLVKPTPVFHAVKERLLSIRPALVIIDNAIDVFAGDANDAAQVKQFMHLLSGLSLEADCPVVLLAHPSRSGMSSGTGDGNSVHWSNSARSRLYLTRILTDGGDGMATEDDPAARVLKVMKANYSATGDEIRMRWEDGCFVHAQAERIEPGDEIGAARKAERVFMHLLGLFERQGRHVSASPSNTYAPVVFAKHEQREGVSKSRFERAMNSLFDQGKIEIVEHGPPSTRRRHLAIVEGVE